jgi:hypothetical protein
MNAKAYALVIAAMWLSACGSSGVGVQSDSDVWKTSEQSKFKVKLAWTSGPVANDYSTALLSFELADQAKIETVEVVGFDPQMPSMGHGTETEDQEFLPVLDRPDQIEVKGIYFIMGGPWLIHVDARVNGALDRVDIEVRVP